MVPSFFSLTLARGGCRGEGCGPCPLSKQTTRGPDKSAADRKGVQGFLFQQTKPFLEAGRSYPGTGGACVMVVDRE